MVISRKSSVEVGITFPLGVISVKSLHEASRARAIKRIYYFIIVFLPVCLFYRFMPIIAKSQTKNQSLRQLSKRKAAEVKVYLSTGLQPQGHILHGWQSTTIRYSTAGSMRVTS